MADTYHPQILPYQQLTLTSSIVPVDSFSIDYTYFDIKETSTQIPMHQEIISQYELYAPGSLTSWPDNLKPQYRISAYATMVTEPPVVTTTFPALTLAF